MSAAELLAIAGEMRAQAAGGLANTVRNELRKGRGPVRAAVTASVLAGFPKRGGLNVWVSESSFSYRVRGSRRIIAAVKVGKAGHDLQGLDDGLDIHPFYGARFSSWYRQAVPPGLISDPIREEGGHQLELAAVIGIEEMAIKIIAA